MGSVISSGVGSGLDVTGLVTKLVEAEGKPKSVRLDAQEAKAQSQLSALGTLRSALASFQDSLGTLKKIDNFRGREVALSSEDFLGVTASASAAPGSYSIEVEKLASAHRLSSQTYPAGPSEAIGTGTLTISRGASSFTVEVSAEHQSLAEIADAINDSKANVGVFAAVVNGVDGARLTLASSETGAVNKIVVKQSGGDGGLADLVYDPLGSGVTTLDEIGEALDARVLIDGFPVTSKTNTISGAVEGLELTLTAKNEPGETTTATVGYSKDGARETLEKLVKSYNGLIDAVASVASFDPETKKGGALFGDAGVRNIVYQLRRELTANVTGLNGPFDVLSEVGITAELDGKLSIDTKRLDAAFATDFDAIGELFSAEDTGVAVRLDKLVDTYLHTGGIFDSRNTSLKAAIEDIGDRREALDKRLVALQARYTKQFNALDGFLTQLQSTSAFLNQQLSNLPGAVFNRG